MTSSQSGKRDIFSNGKWSKLIHAWTESALPARPKASPNN